MDDNQYKSWNNVVGNLSQSILCDDDKKVKIISNWLDRIRETPSNCCSTFLVRMFLRNGRGEFVNEVVTPDDLE